MSIKMLNTLSKDFTDGLSRIRRYFLRVGMSQRAYRFRDGKDRAATSRCESSKEIICGRVSMGRLSRDAILLSKMDGVE